MILIFLAVLLWCFFYFRARRISLERYPNADAEALIVWKNTMLEDYRAYGAMIVFWIFMAYANAVLIHLSIHNHGWPYKALVVGVAVLIFYMLVCLCVVGRGVLKHRRLARVAGV